MGISRIGFRANGVTGFVLRGSYVLKIGLSDPMEYSSEHGYFRFGFFLR